MSKTARRSIKISAVVAAILVVASIFISSNGRWTLARYKSSLRARGEKLTYKELGATPSTNADHVAALQVLAVFSNYSALSSGLFPRTLDYIAPGRVSVSWRNTLRIDASTNATTDWDSLDRQNKAAAPALAQIRAALKNPPPDTGFIYDDDFNNVIAGPARTFSRDRVMAQSFQRDVIGELHHGNLDNAIEDLHALIGQVRMNRNELTLTSQMIRVAIAGLSLSTTWEALQAPGWDEARLASLQKDWEQADFMAGLERSFEASRANCSVIMAEVRRSGVNPIRNQFKGGPPLASSPTGVTGQLKTFWTEALPWFIYRVNGSPNEDEMTQLWFTTRSLELVRLLNAGRPWPEIAAGINNLGRQLDRKIKADHFHRLRVTAFALPNYFRAIETAIHNETQRRLTIAAIAIKRHELKYGKPPETLSALVPEFVAKVPIDPMNAAPLCYRVTGDNSFVFYSVGEDGKDDGGKGGMALWSTPDVVWPTAATPAEEEAVILSDVTVQ